MSFPVYLHFGALRLHPHLFFETLAYAAAFLVYLRVRRQRGDTIDHSARWWVIAAAAVGAVLGSKLLYWLEDPRLTLAHWNDPVFLMAGKTIVGALIGGLLVVEWTKLRLGVTRRTGDLFVLPLCAGIAIGRVGCFLTGIEDHRRPFPHGCSGRSRSWRSCERLECLRRNRLAKGVSRGQKMQHHNRE